MTQTDRSKFPGRNLFAAIGRAFDPELRQRFGITVPEWRVILMLAHRPGVSMAEITDVWSMDKMAVSRAVGRLEREGLIRRAPSEADRRRFALELTAAGRNLFDRIDPVATVRYQTILTELSDADRAALAELLNRLIAATEGPLEADAGPPH
jgi:DNA-binding MarR family transcriptional regulator